MRKVARCGAAFLFLSLASHIASASLVQLTSASTLASSDNVLTYTGYPQAIPLTSQVSFAGTGNVFTFTADGFEVYQVGTNYFSSGFPSGINILYTHAGSGGVSAPDPSMDISLSTPVTQVGFNLEQYSAGSEFFSIDVLTNSGSSLFTVLGNDPSSLAFFGVEATSGTTITGLQITSAVNTDLGIGPITYGDPAPSLVSEPGSITLLATGLIGLVGVSRARSV
jgi:hypothetical protein